MVILEDAWTSAQQLLDTGIRSTQEADIVIVAVIDHPKAWAFTYNTRGFLEDGDFLSSLVGNGPVVVPKSGGTVFLASSAEPIEAQLDRLPPRYQPAPPAQ